MGTRNDGLQQVCYFFVLIEIRYIANHNVNVLDLRTTYTRAAIKIIIMKLTPTEI